MTWKQKVKQYYASHPDQVRQLRKLAAAGSRLPIVPRGRNGMAFTDTGCASPGDLWASNELSLAEGKIQVHQFSRGIRD